jgi:ABC-2 type transport system permease protein
MSAAPVVPMRRRSAVAQTWLLVVGLLRIRGLAVRREWSSSAVHLAAMAAGAALFGLIFTGTYIGVRALDAAGAAGLLASVPAWAFLVYLLTDIVIAFGQALGDFYASRDMPLLLALPVRIPALVTAKFVLGVVQNELYIAVFLLPFVLGYLAALNASWLAYPVMVIGIAVFPAILYAALVVVTIMALRVVPARLAKEGLWLVGAIVPTAFWIMMFYRVANIGGNVATMSLPAPPSWLPSTWLGWALAAFGGANGGGLQAGLGWTALLVFETFAICPPALWLVARAFAHGWSDSFAAGARRTADPLAAIGSRRSGVIALATKDLTTFLRTPQLWFNHIGALMFVVYLLVGHAVQTPILPLTVQLAMVQIGFVAVLGSVTPGMTSLSLEHSAIWLLKSAPLRSHEVLIAKVLVPFGQTATIAALGGALLSAGYGFGMLQSCAVVMFGVLITACSISLGVAFDTRYPSFAWENPNSINRGPRMVVPFLNGLGMLLICAAVLFASKAALHGMPAVAVGLLASAVLVAAAVWETLGRASHNLKALEV